MILLDTDVCVELLRGNRRILQRRDQYDGPVGVCFMAAGELYYGAEKSADPARTRSAVERLLLTVDIIHTDLAILMRFGSLKASLQREGIPLSDADILIASATMEKAEVLVTGNAKHFERIRGLVLEDWT